MHLNPNRMACKGPTGPKLVESYALYGVYWKGTDDYSFNHPHYRKLFQQKLHVLVSWYKLFVISVVGTIKL